MTLNEAIKHARDTAENRTDLCEECRAEHEQLAEWLEELRRLKETDLVEVRQVNAFIQRLRRIPGAIYHSELKRVCDEFGFDYIERSADDET